MCRICERIKSFRVLWEINGYSKLYYFVFSCKMLDKIYFWNSFILKVWFVNILYCFEGCIYWFLEDGFKYIYFYVMGDLLNFNKEKRRNIREIVVVMVGCKIDWVFLNGYCYLESFIVIVLIEVIYVGKLVVINE